MLVQPNSAKDQNIGVHANALKIKVTAPVIENKANQQRCLFIAKLCGMSKAKVKLESGQQHRKKRIRVLLTESILPA